MRQRTVHKTPTDLQQALLASPKALVVWEDISPLARNEWICWTVSVKQQKTRDEHVIRTVKQLAEGKRRHAAGPAVRIDSKLDIKKITSTL